jgi:succinate dehydrogenase hydrophobic anchor subunit
VNSDPSTESDNISLESWKRWARGLFLIFIIVAILVGVLFVSAGRLDWQAAWLLSLLYAIFLVLVMIWGIRNAPELMRERGKVASNVRVWDKIINAIYAALLLVLLVIAGSDAG